MGNLQGPPEQDWDQMDIEEILRLAYEENTDELERNERMARRERHGRHGQSRYVREYSSSRYASPYGNKSCGQVFFESVLSGAANVLSNYLCNKIARRQCIVYAVPQAQCCQRPLREVVSDEAVPVTVSRRECDHPFMVEKHLMALSCGRKASPEKVAMAAEAGFVNLPEGKTWVKTYTKGGKE